MNTPVSFELAKLLKEKGFDEECNHYYEHSLTESYHEEDEYSGPFGWKKGETNYQSGFHINNSKYDSSNEAWFLCSAPTISEVVMWLYEKYNIWISVSPVFEFNDGREDYLTLQGYQYYITVITDNKYNQEKTHADRGHKNIPTEAYEAAINYVLNHLI